MSVVRSLRRRVVGAIPEDRRIKGLGGARGRGWLQARKLVAPLFQRPVILRRDDVLLRIGCDPVDEKIAQQLLGPHRDDYFPKWRGTRPERPCILDVGAHHGFFAVMALHEYPDSTIICVEPSRGAIADLQANLALNHLDHRARIVNVALAPTSGSGELRHTADGTWGYSLYEDVADAHGSETVRLATLEDILAGERPDIVKSNAEGAEFALIEQLAASDLRPQLLIVMVHPDFGDMDRLIDTANGMGYDVERVGIEHRPALHLWRRP
jgi:FkbM family methyltransferase